MTFVETVIVELKRQYTPSISKEIVAFANTDGGTVYIGVEDDGNVLGVEDAHAVEEAVNNVIHDAIAPDLSMFAEAHVERFEDVDIVVVQVHRGPDRPYCVKGKGLRPEGVYVRRGTSAQPLSFEGIRRLIRQESDGRFEDARSLRQDLTFDQAEGVFKRHDADLSDPHARSLGLIADDGFFTNLGYLLSDRCERGVKIARFSGLSKRTFQTRREFAGSVLVQVEGALAFLDVLNNVRAEFDGRPERVETRDYPPEAIREALLNAVVHRDYGIRADISVNVFDDRCEIVSPGGLPEGATVMAALAGVSVPRNARLAAVLYRLQWIEAYGTGIMKIRGSYEGTGLQPEIEFMEGVVKVVLPNMNMQACASGAGSEEGGSFAVKGALPIAGPMASVPEVSSAPSGRAAVLASLRRMKVASARQIAADVGFSSAKTARLLKELVASGMAEAEGNTRARVYRARR